MPKPTPLPQPIFDEPVFNEGVASPDPTRFKQTHVSDTAQYKQIQNLLKKNVVSFDPSRAKPGDLYSLQDALGPHGAEVVTGIENAGQVVFHALGDTGASNGAARGGGVVHRDFCHGAWPDTLDIEFGKFSKPCARSRDVPSYFCYLDVLLYSGADVPDVE